MLDVEAAFQMALPLLRLPPGGERRLAGALIESLRERLFDIPEQ